MAILVAAALLARESQLLLLNGPAAPSCRRAKSNGGRLRQLQRSASPSKGLLAKLRAKSEREKPPLKVSAEAAKLASSALPPGSAAPEFRAPVHRLLKERPELLSTATTAADFDFAAMTPEDAEDLYDLQSEWFPEASYPGGLPRCQRLLAHPATVAIKASFPGEDAGTAGVVVLLINKEAIEEFTNNFTMQLLRDHVAVPNFIPWDSPSRCDLAYLSSLGVIGELRRRGVAAELLRRGLESAVEQVTAAGGQLRAAALEVPAYNAPAVRCYEAAGFRLLHEGSSMYTSGGRCTHNGFVFAKFFDGDADGQGR